MGITDYGHRGVPNAYLTAPLKSDGDWNSAHFANKEYDGLVANFVSALDLEAQRQAAGKIQTLLLEETPLIMAYFYDFISAAKKGATGIELTAMGHVFLRNAIVPS
jgi:peptide/nickel transport system substrate-binding protein